MIATGDDHAWAEVKQMRRLPDVLSTRVGRTWRVLFRIDGDRLEVRNVIHRRDLDATIERMLRG